MEQKKQQICHKKNFNKNKKKLQKLATLVTIHMIKIYDVTMIIL